MNKASLGLPYCFLFFGLLFVSCGKHASANPDAELQRRLAGTWVLSYSPFGSNFQGTIIVNPDGGYVVHCRDENPNGIRTFDIQGTYGVTNGWLFNTITDESITTNKAALPFRETNQIVKLTDSELIINYGTSNEPFNGTFRKEGK